MLVAVATTFVRLARSKIVSCSHRLTRRLKCACAVRLPPNNAILPADKYDCTRQTLVAQSPRRSAHPSAPILPTKLRLTQAVQPATAPAQTAPAPKQQTELRRFLSVSSVVSFNFLNLDPSSAWIQTRQRDRQLPADIDLAKQSARDGLLQRRHIAIRHEVSSQSLETLQ